MKNIILALLTVATLGSCSTMATSKSKVGTTQVSISNTKWALADQVKGKTPTLVIESGKIFGNAGCNNYFGNASIDATAGNFSTSNIGSTKMSCDNMSVEDNFLKMLQETNKYVVSGQVLELYKNELLLLKFNKL